MGFTRLFLPAVSDSHLRLLARALESAPTNSMEQWLGEWNDGRLAVFETEGGLLGLRLLPDLTWVEFVVGQGLIARAAEVVEFCKSFGKSVEAIASRPGLVKVYERAGFVPLGTWMRL